MMNSSYPSAPGFDYEHEKNQFMWYDYLIFILTLLIALGIGVWSALAGDKQRSTSSYLMGNRSFKPFPVAVSMFMSDISAIMVLGTTAEIYLHGIQIWFQTVGSAMAFFLSGLIFVRLFFPLNLTSSFEYLEMRFKSRAVKLTGTILLMIAQVMYMGIAMYSPAIALDSVTPIPAWVAIVVIGIVCTIYTTIGGMKAVVWTDVFQGFVLFGGLVVIMVVGMIKVGGFMRVFEIASKAGRLESNYSPDPTIRLTVWSLVVGRCFSAMQTTGTGQPSVQRYCALPTKKQAVMSVWLNIPFIIVVKSIACFVGLIVCAYYWELGCDPLRTGKIKNSNQLLPYFVVDVLKAPGLTGLFVAVLFSGCLSSVSSSMNSLSAIAWKDMMEWKFHLLPEWKKALITKLLSAGFGFIAILFAFFVGTMPGNVLQISMSFTSGVGAPLLGMFILGSFFPWTNKWGALAGGWFGFLLNVIALLGRSAAKPHVSHLDTSVYNCPNGVEIASIPEDPEGVFILFRVSFMWLSVLGVLTTVLVGLIVTLATGSDEPAKQDPLLTVPIFDILLGCLPNKWLRILRCGVLYDDIELDENGYAIKHLDAIRCNEKEMEIEIESAPENISSNLEKND